VCLFLIGEQWDSLFHLGGHLVTISGTIGVKLLLHKQRGASLRTGAPLVIILSKTSLYLHH